MSGKFGIKYLDYLDSMFTFETLDENIIWLQPYRGVSIIRCRIKHEISDNYQSENFFTDLIASPAYHITYISPESWRSDSVDSHGPFAIRKIQPQHYHALTKSEFIQSFFDVLNDLSYYPERPSDEQIKEVSELLNSFTEKMFFCRFEKEHLPARLHKREYTFDFEWSFMLWEFVEFLVIDPMNKLLYILVIILD